MLGAFVGRASEVLLSSYKLVGEFIDGCCSFNGHDVDFKNQLQCVVGRSLCDDQVSWGILTYTLTHSPVSPVHSLNHSLTHLPTHSLAPQHTKMDKQKIKTTE